MEPIEAKKFQAKNIKEYVVDLAQAQNVSFLIHCTYFFYYFR